jgi:hypothetical protein
LTVHDEAPFLAAPSKVTDKTIVLDETGVRELLAGFRLELGDERAKTAAALTENMQLRSALLEAREAHVLRPALVGVGVGLLIGGLGAALLFGLTR